jgi:hypothetical protein
MGLGLVLWIFLSGVSGRRDRGSEDYEMKAIVLMIINVLLGVAVVVLTYWATIWVLGLLGVPVPERILTVIFVIIGLLIAGAILSGKIENWWVKPLVILVPLLPLLAALSGCAQMFTAKTKASYKVTSPTGVVTEALYESDKEQVGFDAEIDPTTGKVHVKADKSGTLESVVAAIAAQQAQIGKLFETILPMAAQAAKAGS